MKHKTSTLDKVCSIRTGAPISRVKKIQEGKESRTVQVLTPKAMANGRINRNELATETVGAVREEFFTHKDDVVIKLSTPYDSVYIDEDNVGVLITSFGMILRKLEGAQIDMQFLSMFLNSSVTASVLASKSTGIGIQVLKRANVANLEMPMLPLVEQKQLARLFRSISERRSIYERLMALDNELVNNQLMQAIWGD